MRCDEDGFGSIKKVLIKIPGVLGVELSRMDRYTVIVVML